MWNGGVVANAAKSLRGKIRKSVCLATVEGCSKRWKAKDWLGALLLLRKAKSGGREWVTEGNIWEGTWTDLSWAARTPQARFLRHGRWMSRSAERRCMN